MAGRNLAFNQSGRFGGKKQFFYLTPET